MKDELQEKAERLAESYLFIADNVREAIKEEGAREMVQIVVQFWTRHECDPEAPILSCAQVEDKCLQLWREGKK